MRYVLCYILCVNAWWLIAQITVSGAWEKDTVIIGDEANYILSIEISDDSEITAVDARFLDSVYSVLASVKAQTDTSQPLIPKVADFELLDIGRWTNRDQDEIFQGDELQWQKSEAGNTTLLQNIFRFRLWDPGETVILTPAVAYVNGVIQDQIVTQDQSTIFVIPPGGTELLDSLGLADIKPIMEEPVRISDYMMYFIALAAALILGLLYWWWTKYQSRDRSESVIIEAPIIIPPAHEVALEELNILKDKQLWQQGKIKAYQSQLTHIIRSYLENRYGVQALESTTAEIINIHIKDLLDNEDKHSLERILQVADLVKFAKAKPEESIHESFMNEAVDFVERTKEIEIATPDE